jgi:hypothetical protein
MTVVALARLDDLVRQFRARPRVGIESRLSGHQNCRKLKNGALEQVS